MRFLSKPDRLAQETHSEKSEPPAPRLAERQPLDPAPAQNSAIAALNLHTKRRRKSCCYPCINRETLQVRPTYRQSHSDVPADGRCRSCLRTNCSRRISCYVNSQKQYHATHWSLRAMSAGPDHRAAFLGQPYSPKLLFGTPEEHPLTQGPVLYQVQSVLVGCLQSLARVGLYQNRYSH